MSDHSFPPTTTRVDEVTMLLEAFASVTEGRSATYVSSPLTTGARAFEWHRRNGGHTSGKPGAFETDVVEPNREEAAAFARSLRATMNRVVIDPTAMADIPEWRQSDYRYFWGRVIEEYCDEIVLRDGWQFSSGCSYELLVGWETQARLLRQDLTPLKKEEAEELLTRAIEETEAHGASAAFLHAVRQALTQPRGYAWRT
jgi:hypothetical protein